MTAQAGGAGKIYFEQLFGACRRRAPEEPARIGWGGVGTVSGEGASCSRPADRPRAPSALAVGMLRGVPKKQQEAARKQEALDEIAADARKAGQAQLWPQLHRP